MEIVPLATGNALRETPLMSKSSCSGEFQQQSIISNRINLIEVSAFMTSIIKSEFRLRKWEKWSHFGAKLRLETKLSPDGRCLRSRRWLHQTFGAEIIIYLLGMKRIRMNIACQVHEAGFFLIFFFLFSAQVTRYCCDRWLSRNTEHIIIILISAVSVDGKPFCRFQLT